MVEAPKRVPKPEVGSSTLPGAIGSFPLQSCIFHYPSHFDQSLNISAPSIGPKNWDREVRFVAV